VISVRNVKLFECKRCNLCERNIEPVVCFFPSERWKVKFFPVKKIDGIYYLHKVCPFFKGECCTLYGNPLRPLDCFIYPCFPNTKGEIEIDPFCPNHNLVTPAFIDLCKSIIKAQRVNRKFFGIYNAHCMYEHSLQYTGLPSVGLKGTSVT